MKSVLYCQLEFIKPKRLGKTNVSARIFHFFQGGQIAAHANDMNVRTLRFQEFAELYSVNSGHVGVCHDNIVPAFLEKPDGLEPIARFIDPRPKRVIIEDNICRISGLSSTTRSFTAHVPPSCE